MEAVRTIRPSRFPKPVHNLPLSQHKRLPANENAANENGPDKGGDPVAAAALAVLEAAERAGHLPPMTTEKFIAACKLAAANLPPANDDAAELAQATTIDRPDAAELDQGARVTTAARARKAVNRHAAHAALKQSTGSTSHLTAPPASPITPDTPEGFEFECWGCEVKSRADQAKTMPAGFRLVGSDRENYVYCGDCGPTDAEVAAGAPWDVHAASAPYVNANLNPDDYQAPEQGA